MAPKRGSSRAHIVIGNDGGNRLFGTSERDRLDGRGGADQIYGGSGDDALIGGRGADTLDGGAGDDDSIYRGSVRDYVIGRSGDSFVVQDMAPGRHGDDGADIVRDIERLRFLDRTAFLDGSNNAPIADEDRGFVVLDGQELRIQSSELLANDRELDGDRLNIVGVSLGAQSGVTGETDPAGRSVRIKGDSVWYSPASGFQSAAALQDTYEDSFFSEVSDGRGGFDTQSVTVTIAGPDAEITFVPGQDTAPTQDDDATTAAAFDAQTERRGPPSDHVVVGGDRSNRIFGTPDRDRLEGHGGADQLFGGTGDDVLFGGSGDDALDGGAGGDDAFYAGSVRDYAITRSGNDFVVKDLDPHRLGDDGADLVRDVERLRFLDRTVFLDGTNNVPLAEHDKGFVSPDGVALSIRASDLLANDRDFDGDQLQIINVYFTVCSGCAGICQKVKDVTGTFFTNGRSVSLEGDSIVYTPVRGFQWAAATNDSYTDTFFYTVSDGHGGVANQSVTVTITNPDATVPTLVTYQTSVGDTTASTDATFSVSETKGVIGEKLLTVTAAVDDPVTTRENSPATIDVLANDRAAVSVSSVDVTGTAGIVKINPDNTISYHPAGAFDELRPGEKATDTFTYTASDAQGGEVTGNVTVTVTGPTTAAVSPIVAVNPIVAENMLPGNPQSEWGINGPDSRLEGFATDISIDQGNTVQFKIDHDAAITDYRIDIYRLGYYDGLGARKVATIDPSSLVDQPAPLTDPATGLIDAGNWAVSAAWDVPEDAASGVYVAKLVSESGPFAENHMYFVVRDDDGGSDVLFQTSDTTWQAYNNWGGNSLYEGSPAGRAFKVSYNRPYDVGTFVSEVSRPIFESEFPMIQWLESNGYDVSYSTGVDTDRRGQELLEHDIFLSVGHDEYWSGRQRANVEAARDAGVNLAFFSGNEVFWKTRWEDSLDATGTPNRTLVVYKTSKDGVADPSGTWTGTWRDPQNAEGDPENALTGTIYQVNAFRFDTIEVSDMEGKLRFWRDTSLANLAPGQTATLTDNVLGFEWDVDIDNGFRPAGLIPLSSTSIAVPAYLQDNGNTYGPGIGHHSLTLYRAESGALVFGAGTVRWSWGLDESHTGGSSVPDPRMQQATVNLFADMGVQPGSLQSGLLIATASNDATRPVSLINPIPGGLTAGSSVTITGTASDVGGRVAAVEVSVDNGLTWRRAEGTANWSFGWTPQSAGPSVVKSRAVDDSLNMETQGPTVAVTIAPSVGTSLFRGETPAGAGTDATNYEFGTKFSASQSGTITALQYYRVAGDAGDTDTRSLSLWNAATGQRLGVVSVTSAGSSTGWQVGTLAAPIAIQAGLSYVVSYGYVQNGAQDAYAFSGGFFAGASNSSPDGVLTAPSSGGTSGGLGNGLFSTTVGILPQQTFNAANYWVDVVFTTGAGGGNTPPSFTSPAAFTVDENLTLVGAVVATDAQDPVTYALAGGVDLALFQINSSTGALSFRNAPDFEAPGDAGGNNQYNVIVSASDGTNPAVQQAITIAVTDVAEGPSAGTSLFRGETPAGAGTDATNYEFGTKFSASQSGTITALQYYRVAGDAGDTDTRSLSLWNAATGQRLGVVSVTSAGSSTGWQVGTLAAPIAIQAGLSYVVSYGYVQNGAQDAYAFSGGFFAGASNSSPDGVLTAPSSGGTSGGLGNGLFSTTVGILPQQTFNAANYWVDVVFTTGAGGGNTPPSFTSPAAFTVDENLTLVGAVVATDAQDPVTYALAGGVDLALFQINSSTGALSFRNAPNFEAPGDAGGNNQYNVIVSASDGTNPAVQQAITIAVTDVDETPSVGTSLFRGETPAGAGTDATNYEFGTKFSASQSGTITALQYYRVAGDAGDTDTRSLSLWNAATGQRLGVVSVTSAGSSTGWQVGTLAAPIAIQAGLSYVVSYGYVQNGAQDAYAFSGGFFAGASNSSPDGVLTAPSSGGTSGGLGNGLFSTTVGILPQQTFNAANYWVDVVFTTGAGGGNTPPSFTSPAAFTVDENLTLVGAVVATDAQDPVTYALAGGVDLALFQINSSTGALSFRNAPNFEAPGDAGGNNQYNVIVSASDGTNPAVQQAITIAVKDVDETPSVGTSLFRGETPAGAGTDATNYEFGTKFSASQSGTITALQYYRVAGDAGDTDTRSLSLWNAATGQRLGVVSVTSAGSSTGWQVGTLAAPIAIQAGLSYVVSYGYVQNGAQDAYAFSGGFFAGASNSSPDGVLTAPSSGGTSGGLGNGLFSTTVGILPQQTFNAANYWVDVVFTTGAGGGNTPPSFTSPAAFTVDENLTLVGAVVATDAQDPVTYALAGGVDLALFQINSSTGALSFRNAPNFEAPGDAGGNNQYNVIVSASDGTNPAVQQAITIAVKDVDEGGQTITGTSASNTLIGGDGADTISGLGGNDSLQGNGGTDTLDGGSGTDNVNGGTGDDLIIVRGTEAQGDTMIGGTGIDTLRITGTADLTLNGTALITEIEVLDGGGRALRGTNSVANVLDLSGFTTVTNLTQVLGLSGADSLTGSSGADTLDGGVDIDTVRGGDGDDAIIVRGTEAQGDTMTGGAGTDTLRIVGTANLVLSGTNLITGIETLDGGGRSLSGTSAANVIDLSGFTTVTNLASVLGLAGNDTLTGGSGNETLDGGTGVDTVRGGGGDDTILVSGNQATTDTMDGGAGQDRILVSAAGGNFTLSGTSRLANIEQINGSGVAIQGSSGADTFDFSGISLVSVSAILGLGGADTLIGSGGDDIVTGGTGNDIFVFRLGQTTGNDSITDFDASGNDVIRLAGYSPSVNLVRSRPTSTPRAR